MAKPTIAIVGLGLLGASVGLGLQRETGDFEIVGHDRDPETTGIARKQGAVHRTEWNLHRTCEGADMIILAVPLSELEVLLGQIAEDVKPGTLVMAVTSLMQPAIELAKKDLGGHTHFVVGHPILSGIGGTLEPRADLFQEVTFALAPGFDTDPAAIQLAGDFVERLGATPFFVDPHEHDGIIAGVEQLPQVLAAALMSISSASAGWREARRMAGRQFAGATELGGSAEQLFSALRRNKDNLIYRIRQMEEELALWRGMLEDGSEPAQAAEDAGGSALNGAQKEKESKREDKDAAKHPLLTALENSVAERIAWEAQVTLKNWDEMPRPAAAPNEGPGLLRQMFFGNMGRGKNRDKR
jgi:prephenate dehydrogenase